MSPDLFQINADGDNPWQEGMVSKATYIGIELTNETREVPVLEISWKKNLRELGQLPDDKALVRTAPRDDGVRGYIFDHVIGLGKKRSWKMRRRRRRRSGSSTRCGEHLHSLHEQAPNLHYSHHLESDSFILRTWI
jgi:hypothetical protein